MKITLIITLILMVLALISFYMYGNHMERVVKAIQEERGYWEGQAFKFVNSIDQLEKTLIMMEKEIKMEKEKSRRLQEIVNDNSTLRSSMEMNETIKRLRRENKRLDKENNDCWLENDTLLKSIEHLQGINKRYREALEEIARGRFPGASYKARKALEESQ